MLSKSLNETDVTDATFSGRILSCHLFTTTCNSHGLVSRMKSLLGAAEIARPVVLPLQRDVDRQRVGLLLLRDDHSHLGVPNEQAQRRDGEGIGISHLTTGKWDGFG